MKRLLCIVSCMNSGGAETFLMKIYRQLDRSLYQMDFCINQEGEQFYEREIQSLGGRIYRIPSKSSSIQEFKKQLFMLIQKYQYKYVLRITSNALGFMDLKIAKRAGAQVCCARSSNSSDGEGIKAYVAHRIGKLLYNKYVDVRLAPSDLAAQYTFGKKAYRNGEVDIIHNAVDLEIFHYDETGRNAVRNELNIRLNAKVIGHIGRFEKQKNHAFLVDVFYEIHRYNPDTVLVLVGQGTLQEEIHAKVIRMGLENSVIFAGVRSDIPQLLSAMDIFVFPSFYEGMPNTVIEAQSTGLPCVVSDQITKGVAITDLVTFRSLKNKEEWVQSVLDSLKYTERKDTKKDFLTNRYNISEVVQDFIKKIYDK